MNVFSHKRHTGKLAMSATAIAAASILSVVSAQAADVASQKMVLTAYVNGAGGESVMAGNFDTALTEIKKDRATSSEMYTAKITNECVTYAALKQLQQAMSSCSEALRSAKSDRLSALRYSAGSTLQNSYVAIAYTNRAVVQMLSKNTEGAKSDMARAKSLAPDTEAVSRNLLVMQTSGSKIAQIDAAPAR
jgi:tetratricopeptide (TPR) repeat protein